MSRIYSEQEAADLFRRAAEHQATRTHPDAPGLTLEELKRAGQAAGIDPASLDYALTVPATTSREPTRFLGYQTSVFRQRFVPHAIDDDSWGRIVRDLRDHLGGQGTTETLGGIHEWKRAPLSVVAEPVEGGTDFRASASWHAELKGGVAFSVATLLFFLVLIVVAAADGETAPMLLFGTFAAVSLGFCGFTLNRYRGKAERVAEKFDAALERAAQRLADADAAPAVTEAIPQIGLDDAVSHEIDAREPARSNTAVR